jgi:hypothetical protein
MRRTIAVAAIAVAFPLTAMAEELCEVASGSALISEDKVREIAAAAGYSDIRKVEEEDGCLEAKGMSRDGKKVEVYVHPVSGDIVKIKLE